MLTGLASFYGGGECSVDPEHYSTSAGNYHVDYYVCGKRFHFDECFNDEAERGISEWLTEIRNNPTLMSPEAIAKTREETSRQMGLY